jgi:Leucine-rich repeat (LRR) protein
MSDLYAVVNENQQKKEITTQLETIQSSNINTQKINEIVQLSNQKQSDLKNETNPNEISDEEKKRFKLSLFTKDEENENEQKEKRDFYLNTSSEFDFKNYKLEYLNTRLMQKCRNLEKIYLDSNQIKELEPGTFQQCTNLECVTFSSNQIKELHPETFQQCKKLKYIRFSSNQIKELNPETFQQCDRLEHILFNSNQIRELEPETFKNLPNLGMIDFSSNQIKELHPSIFKNCKQLFWIDFHSNQIQELHSGIFEELTELNILDFSYNQIKELHPDTFRQCRFFGKVNFCSNQIQELSPEIFRPCKYLNSINFSSNRIKELRSESFEQFEELNEVNFNSNELNDVNIELLANIMNIKLWKTCSLSFSNNFLKRLPFFHSNKSIRLDLRNNFKSFDIPLFYSYFNLTKDDFIKYEYKSILSNFNYFKQFKLNEYLPKRNETDKYKIFLCRKPDFTFLKETFFLLFFNKSVYNLDEDNVCEAFISCFEKFKNFEWSILDLLLCFVEHIGQSNLINLNAHIKSELKQNPKSLINLEFKLRSGECVMYLSEFNDVSLFDVFFNYDLSIKEEQKQFDNASRIYDYLAFYRSIDFETCFGIAIENGNEDIAIKLLHLLKHSIFDLNLNVLNKNFNFNFLRKILKKFFDLNWCNAIEFLLDLVKEENVNASNSCKALNLDLSDLEKNETIFNKVSPLLSTENKNSDNQKAKHILELIIESKTMNEEKQNLFLKHFTTKYLLHKKWSLIPRVFYYANLFLFSLFLLFYSINIEIYSKKDKNFGLNVTCKCVCFLTLFYFILLEFLQIVYTIASGRKFEYLRKYKNWSELLIFPLCIVALLCDLFSSEIHLMSSLYSMSILGAYFVFASRLDKIPYIGVYIDVIGQILAKSLSILVILLIALIAFILAFRNRSTFYELESSENQMSYFNTTFEFNLFQLTAFSLGGISTENMGIEFIEGKTLVNYLIYACFIFIMPIMFLNIFQSISIGEVQKLFEDSEANEVRTKIEYVLLFEKLKTFKDLPRLKSFFSRVDLLILMFNNVLFEKVFKKLTNNKNSNESHTNVSSEKSIETKIESLNAKIKQLISQSSDQKMSEKIESKIEKLENKMEKIENILLLEMQRKLEKRQKRESKKNKP